MGKGLPLEGWRWAFWSHLSTISPSEWMGVDRRGLDVVVRYRWGVLQVWVEGTIRWNRRLGDELDGYIKMGRQTAGLDIFGLAAEEGDTVANLTGVYVPDDTPRVPDWYWFESIRDRVGAGARLIREHPERFDLSQQASLNFEPDRALLDKLERLRALAGRGGRRREGIFQLGE